MAEYFLSRLASDVNTEYDDGQWNGPTLLALTCAHDDLRFTDATKQRIIIMKLSDTHLLCMLYVLACVCPCLHLCHVFCLVFTLFKHLVVCFAFFACFWHFLHFLHIVALACMFLHFFAFCCMFLRFFASFCTVDANIR